jgi:hypothetical protein
MVVEVNAMSAIPSVRSGHRGLGRSRLTLPGVAAALFLAACAPAPTPPLPGAVVPFADAATLIESLEHDGVALTPIGRVTYAWFATPALTFEAGPLRQDALFVHEHADTAGAQADARRVSPDGRRIVGPNNESIRVEWLGEPHLYQSGRLLVVYVGQDPDMMARLARALGPPFAGAGAAAG